MDAELQDIAFAEFGSDPFNPLVPATLERVDAKRRDDLRRLVREHSPRRPGVYGMLDRRERLIYVGKSKTLRTRLLSYFSPRNAEEKPGKILDATRSIVWEPAHSEFAALLRETQLIRHWTPRWNVQGIPKRQRPVFLCLGRPPAAYFFLSRTPPPDAVTCEGPFHGAGRMTRAVDTLNKYFRLRDCSNKVPMRFADQLQLFEIGDRPGCLRHEVGTCSGPCVGGCSRTQYDAQVAAAQSFVDGFNEGPLDHLRWQMAAAAENLQFELAARRRDDLKALDYLHRKLLFLADARQRYAFVYAPPGTDGRRVWYLIRSGEVIDTVAAPACRETYAAVKPTLRRWRQELAAGKGNGGAFPYTLPLVAGWFRKHRDEFNATIQPAEAGRGYRRLARVRTAVG